MSNAFRILDQNPQFFTIDGEVLAGGSLTFSESGTSTPADTYNGPDLSTPNANPVQLDSAGRATTDIWGDINYRVVVKDSLGAVQYTRDNVEVPGGSGTAIPTLVSGQFLTNDGTNLEWADVLQVPDPSGQNNKILGTDGTNVTWVTRPADGANGAPGTNADVTVTASSVKWSDGTGDLFYIQTGSSSAPASGIPSTSKSITFPVAFKATPVFVKVTVTSNSFATNGKLAIDAVTTKSATGFTVGFDTNTTTDNIFADVPFDWIAFGTIAS